MDLLIEIQAFYEKINIMTILSFHLQQNECFVALEINGETITYSLKMQPGETQGMTLIPFIQKVWREADCPPVALLIASRGPGSFTSLRVGLAAAQGLSLVFPKAKVFAPTHFDVLNYVARMYTKKPCLVLIDSKKGDFYGQIFYGDVPDVHGEYTIDQIKELLMNNQELRVISDFEPSDKLLLNLHSSYSDLTRGSGDTRVKHEDDAMLMDSAGSFFKERRIVFDKNLAACQIEFYKTSSLKETSEYQQFHPYYLHLPQYVKRKPI